MTTRKAGGSKASSDGSRGAVVSRRIKVGDFYLIKLGVRFYAYARAIRKNAYAFYDLRTERGLKDICAIEKRPILFKIYVTDAAIRTGKWKFLGSSPLTPDLEKEIFFFKQDLFDPRDIKIYIDSTGKEKRATLAQCRGLERLAIYSQEHVEDRLRDHFANRPCAMVERMKLVE